MPAEDGMRLTYFPYSSLNRRQSDVKTLKVHSGLYAPPNREMVLNHQSGTQPRYQSLGKVL